MKLLLELQVKIPAVLVFLVVLTQVTHNKFVLKHLQVTTIYLI